MPHRTELYVVVGRASHGTYRETVESIRVISQSDGFYITPKSQIATDSIGELQGVHDYLRMVVSSRHEIRYAKHKIRESFYQQYQKMISDGRSILNEIDQRIDQESLSRQSVNFSK